ncbi:hypothetical protein SAMD00019534_111940 [Acytostelium subglobosum LB1]|uniref:hypothetical protein n=1 Tax=Acytostelium subglobosum LB1 TaxID=1410327 RepID=UPI000644DC0D|nr:hypothetical protein SAMD00019534_111940 [Acytostelium subglobosum LB1]GAM28018.1 hypothetical protein SAMD00019534_111940 [Acytostelium subglobosum LB1]|eukprot:XP_012748977.1 hypothetical protein SAMD00019534_111940 [Acytostelium subglobosum LB1]
MSSTPSPSSTSSSSSSTTKAIPFSQKEIARHDMIDFSTSVGGTIYGTTPGGTKKVYDRNTLLHIRNSPLSKTPPPQVLNMIEQMNRSKVSKSPNMKSQPPAVTVPAGATAAPSSSTTPAASSTTQQQKPKPTTEEDIFEMD